MAGSPSHSEVAPLSRLPLIIPDEEGESGADPSFSMESEDHGSGDSHSESEAGGEEPLFPHLPVPREAIDLASPTGYPWNQEPGDNCGPSCQFEQGRFSLVKAEEDSRSPRVRSDTMPPQRSICRCSLAASLALMLNKCNRS